MLETFRIILLNVLIRSLFGSSFGWFVDFIIVWQINNDMYLVSSIILSSMKIKHFRLWKCYRTQIRIYIGCSLLIVHK